MQLVEKSLKTHFHFLQINWDEKAQYLLWDSNSKKVWLFMLFMKIEGKQKSD